MKWARVKTILIIVLALLNAFLLVSLAVQYRSASYLPGEAAQRASGIMEGHGVRVDAGAIPLELPSLPEVSALGGRELGEKILAALGDEVIIGGLSGDNNVTGDVRPGEEAVQGTLGTVFVSGRGVRYVRGAAAQDGGGGAEDAVHGFMSAMGLARGDYSLQTQGDAVIASQWVYDRPLFGGEVTFRFDGGAIASIEGCLVTDAAAISGGVDAKDAVNMLFLIVEGGYVTRGDSVDEMQLGYLSADGKTGQIALEPVWRVRVSGADCYFDSMTGRPKDAAQ